MSDVHEKHEQPSQYRASCENCGNERIDHLRMHSYLRETHIATIDDVEWNDDIDQIQCNNCGTVRTFPG